MDVQLTVVDEATGATADLRVSAPDATAAAELISALREAVGAPASAAATVAGRALRGDGLVADCPLVDGVIVRFAEWSAGGAEPTRGAVPHAGPALQLVVASGPDSGRRLTLGPAPALVGRAAGCDLPLDDPAASRRHLQLVALGSTATVTDLGSANGTTGPAGRIAPGEPFALPIGSRIQIGDSELVLVDAGRPPDRGSVTSRPTVVRRPPRLTAPPPPLAVDFPSLPTPPAPVRLPILAALAPLAVGVVLAVVLHQWQLLAFTALSPLMVGGQACGDRWHRRRTIRGDHRRYTVATATAERELAAAIVDERRRRQLDTPDLARLVMAVRDRDSWLWQRTAGCPDALRLRLGRGSEPSAIDVRGRPTPLLDGVPVGVDLRATRSFGVCGPPRSSRALVRSLVVQAAVLHAPDELRIILLADGQAQEWAWSRWLPHLGPRRGEAAATLVGFDDRQIVARVAELATPAPASAGPATLVVVDLPSSGPRSEAFARLEAAVDRQPNTAVIWRADDDHDLPRGCHAVARLSGHPGPSLELQRAGLGSRALVTPDLVAADVATTVARELAPLRPGGGQATDRIPRQVQWQAHAGVDLTAPELATAALLRRWSLGPSTEVALGVDAAGVVVTDLRRDGPHALIAGTTGAGKSELLRSLVATLVAANPPDQLSLLLLDHKGGATFAPYARLPHTVGVLTDLDAAATRRALLSLAAEVRRREAVLASAGAVDLESYAAAITSINDPLPRLVIVVDEFAALADEQPDFVGGLVGIAQRGRSLGLHLVLATQRPEGVVSADIRANTRLRICLGVARDSESRDVIDSPDAAHISRQTPGRAYLRIGPGDLYEFQSSRIGGPADLGTAPVITRLPAAVLGAPPETAARVEAGPGDLDRLVDAAIAASRQLGCRIPTPPWRPPLPEQLDLADLANLAAGSPGASAWALADLPALGQQSQVQLDLTIGATTVLVGTARSGRTTAALTIAFAAAASLGPADLHVWGIDAGSGLGALAALPHCGAVVSAHDTERLDRLIAALTDEVTRRRRQATTGDRPTLMVLIDSWEALTTTTADGAGVTDAVLALAADGPSAGLHVVVTADRAGLTGRLAGVATERIVFRLADPSDFTMVGVAGREVPRALPPGRGIRASDQSLVQVATAGPASLAAAGDWPAGPGSVRRFDPLPLRVELDDIVADRRPGQIILGLGADTLHPVVIAGVALGHGFLVAGPTGSGRTSTLALIARQLNGRRTLVCCHADSPLLSWPDVIHVPSDDEAHATALLDALTESSAPPPHVVVDDIDQLAPGPLLDRLEAIVQIRSDPHRAVVVAGRTEALAGAFRGPIARIRPARSGILLGPTAVADGDVLGLQLSRRAIGRDPPGRGWLALPGRIDRLQLAAPGAVLAHPADQHRRYPSTELELSRLGERSRE